MSLDGRSSVSAKSTRVTRAALRDGQSSRSSRSTPSVVQASGSDTAMVSNGTSVLLEAKKAELHQVVDTHDSLVRELFHMQQFTSMVAFDPKEAKEDKSEVFMQFKAPYDLMEQVPLPSSSGPARRTRRAAKGEEQLFGGASSSAPVPSKPFKGKAKKDELIWNILARHKSKSAKGKDKEEVDPGSQADIAERYSPIGDDAGESASAPIPKFKSRSTRRTTISSTDAKIARDVPSPPVEKLRKRTISIPGPSVSKRRKVDPETPALLPPIQPEVVLPPTPDIQTRGGRMMPSRAAANRVQPQKDPPPPPPDPRLAHIKSVRLIVKRPPPLFSNPRQKAPPALHGGSITSFLSSFKTINDQDMNDEAIEQLVASEVSLRTHIANMQSQGRCLPELDFTGLDVESLRPEQPGSASDTWFHCVQEVKKKYKGKKPSVGVHVAGQVAAKIKAYWDAQVVKEERLRAQEEKRLRALAKATIKMVAAEWKKAVFHIREQERAQQEAEELQRGHEHLDAILNQSGQILETQHGDLSRAVPSRSRSRSSGGSVSSDEDSDDESQDEDEEMGVSDEEGSTRSVEGDDEQSKGGDSDDEFALREDDGSANKWSEAPSPAIPSPTIPSPVLSSPDEQSQPIEEEQPTLAASEEPFALPSPATPPQQSQTIVDEDPDSPGFQATIDLLLTESGSSRESSPDPLLSNIPTRNNSPTKSPFRRKTPASNIHFHDDLLLTSPRKSRPSSTPATSRSHCSPPRHSSANPDTEKSPTPQANGHVSGDMDIQGTSSADFREETLVVENESIVLEDNLMEVIEDADVLPPPDDAPISEPLTVPEDDGSLQEPPDADTFDVPEDNQADNDDGKTADDRGVVDATAPSLPEIPDYLRPFAVAPVDWDPNSKITPPLLLRGTLRPYQQSGLEWLASLHINNLNGILADEMGLGKTIQTISLLAHLACDRGIWGPHLIASVVPTSVLLNWEMEFKKFLPGFKILSYHGSTKRRKELRQGWNDKHHFNVCVTSYTLASRDAHIFKRKAWYYMILDEAHMIKNFKSQRWNILLMFRSFRRLLLTGTPLQNNLTELWALLQFLMSGANFANLKEFGEWFSNPLEKAIEHGNALDDETMQRVSKLHQVLRPYLLRRLKRDVEKELPSKYEHLVLCPLSKRQRYLYDEFMLRAQTRDALQSGVYQKIANILMQLRKVCNHPDLFEVRPIVTSFAMNKSAVSDYEIKELLVRRRMMKNEPEQVNLDLLGLCFVDAQPKPLMAHLESRRLDATNSLPHILETPGESPPRDVRSIAGFRAYSAWQKRADTIAQSRHLGYLNRLRINSCPIFGQEVIDITRRCCPPILPFTELDLRKQHLETVTRVHRAVKSYATRADDMAGYVDRFAFVTPAVVALDMPQLTLARKELDPEEIPFHLDAVLHRAQVKLQIAFPDPSLLQYDCGKLQELTRLLREKQAGGHRVLIFTQMTKILDILEIFLNFHGYLYLRLDGATKIEDRQYITERFNADPRIFCFIASSRSGGVGINLTGADTVIFYDSDFNPQMDRQCEDRAHRIGQIRDVHIYRFVSQHTVEEALLRKANQKRSLDDLVIQKGQFDWRSLFNDEVALTKALGEFEDTEDARAAAIATREEVEMGGADEADFGGDIELLPVTKEVDVALPDTSAGADGEPEEPEEEEGGTIAEYMVAFVTRDYKYFKEWRL